MKILITGSLGLIGSEAAWFYLNRGHEVIGIDNDMRKHFFGEEASVLKNMISHENYLHFGIDFSKAEPILKEQKIDVVIHCAAQPSHDWAATNPMLDFGINAYGTLMLLEMVRQHAPEAIFIQVSTNKVYGDHPNHLSLQEMPRRYEALGLQGIDETMPVDQCLHSLFGVSKLAGDLLAQEYARYFGLRTGIFRCGCVTGARHAGAELHGFLSYMVRCKKEKKVYKIYGYKGKQVRDNIHAFDLVTAFDAFIQDPKPGEVYNMGGSRHSNISVLEALDKLQIEVEYQHFDAPRKGDHIWYISDVRKFKSHYPDWSYVYNMESILENLISTQPL